MGIRSSATYELVFENCRVPQENLLGNEGDGFKQTMHVLNGGRVGIAAQALGIAEGAFRCALDFALERQHLQTHCQPGYFLLTLPQEAEAIRQRVNCLSRLPA